MLHRISRIGNPLRKSLKNSSSGIVRSLKQFDKTVKNPSLHLRKSVQNFKIKSMPTKKYKTRDNKFKLKLKDKYISRNDLIIPKDFSMDTDSETKKVIEILKNKFMEGFKYTMNETKIQMTDELINLFFEKVKDLTELLKTKDMKIILNDFKDNGISNIFNYIKFYLSKKYEEFKVEQKISDFGKVPEKKNPFSLKTMSEFLPLTKSEKEKYVLIDVVRKIYTLKTNDPTTYNEVKMYLLLSLGKWLEWYFEQLEHYLNYYEKAIFVFGKKTTNEALTTVAIDSILLNEIEKFDKKRVYINEKNINEIYPLISWFNEHFYELKDNYKKSRDKILKYMKTINEHQENLWSSPGKGFLTPTETNEVHTKYIGPNIPSFMSKLPPEKHIPKIDLLLKNKLPTDSTINFMK